MADVRSALHELLRAEDEDTAREALASALDGVELAAARSAAKDDPTSVEAAASVLGRMSLDGAPEADLVDTAKAAAQRAPRDESGHDVVLLCAEVLWRRTGQAALAEPYYRRVRRGEPAHPRVLEFYRELFGDESKAMQLIQVLVQARRASKEAELRFELAKEVAELAERRAGSPDRAIEMWRAVMREDGYDARASRELERLYRDSGKWTALVDLLKDELDRVPDDAQHKEDRIRRLLEIAELYRDKLNLEAMAQATLQRILSIEPRHEPSLEALGETYLKAGKFNDLLGVYARRLESAREDGDEEREVELLRKVAELWADKLGNPQRALEPLSAVMALRPRDAQARSLLARIHEQRRDFRALITLRREELEELEGDEALALRIELARLAEERLGDRREAVDAWNEVLAHHGDVDQALAALARLYERESRWANAAEIIHRKLADCNREQAVRLLNHLGGLYSDRLHSRPDAVAVWAELLRLDPGHDKATRRLRDAYIADRRWDDLTSLYERQGRVADLVEVLQSAADRIGEVEERVALYRRVAALCQERLGQPERALKALERTLAIQPDNLDVARELLPIYREQLNWARTMSTYEVLLKAERDVDEQLKLIAAMQEVARDRLSSPTLTLHWAARAYRLRPEDESLREGLEQAAERADGWDELTRIYEERIADEAVEDAERLTLLGKLAVVARDRLYKPDDAQRYFRRIIALDPSDAGAMAALEEIYSSTRRWDDLSEVYRKRLDVTEEPAARLQTLRSLARIQERHLGDLEAATASHRAILEIEPADADALEALARIHRNRGEWSELAAVLSRKLELSSSDTARVPLLFELGTLHATRLQEAARAVEEFESVLATEPNHRGAVQELENLRGAEPSTALAVSRVLLPYYKRVDDRVREAEAMEVIVEAEEEPARRREQLETLAAIYEKMVERRQDALRIRERLFAGDPGQWQARQTLHRLGAELGEIERVARAYEQALAGMTAEATQAEQEGRTLPRERAALRRDMLLEFAAMLRDELQRPEDAERAYAEVLEHDETHQSAYEALQSLLAARGADKELVALYRRRVDVTFNPGEQKQLLSRIIEISRNVLGDRETAVSTAEELLDLIPDDLPTIELLADMYAEGATADDHAKLEELLGRQAEIVSDPAQARQLQVRRASLRMQYLGDAFGAVDLLGQVVGEDPDHADATRLLEELLTIAEVQLQACALLEPIYTRHGDHYGRIRVLEVRRENAESIGSVDEAVIHLLEIARIREHEIGDLVSAFEALSEAYLMDVRRFDTRQEAERLGLALGRHQELVDMWRSALASDATQADTTLRIDLTTRLARLLDRHLRDHEAAREVYGDLLALDPPDAALAYEAVEALCRLHLEAGDGVALIEAKRALLRFTDAASEQVRIRLEIASMQEELRDRVGAALTYSEVLDMQPANVVALDALERLFREEKEWQRLVEVLEHRIGVTQDPRGRAVLWRQVGEIQRDELGDSQRAIDAFQSVLDLKVGREDTAHALNALVALSSKLERWPDVEEGLRRLTQIAETRAERAELLTRTAIVVGKRLGRGQDALDLLKRVLDLMPTDARARSEVGRYLEHDETRERAIRILTPLYEAEENWPALLELEELQARNQPSGRRRLQALLRVARTQEERIGDPDRAFAVLCEAMAEAADQPELEEILDKVERLGREQQRGEDLLTAYTSTVDHILDAGLQQRVLRAMGEVALHRLGRLDVARSSYERVLDVAPDDGEASAALEQIYLQQEDYEKLAALLSVRAERAGDDFARDDDLLRAARLTAEKLQRAEDAIGLYERLSSDRLAEPSVQDELEPLYEATGRFRELTAHLSRKLTRLQGHEAVDTHLRLGRLYGQELDDGEAGLKHLSAALRLDPDHAVATEELDRYLEDPAMQARVAEILEPVFAAVADWNRLIQIQEIRLENAPDELSRMRILTRIAQIEEDQLEDLDRAMASYERLFAEQPTNRYVRDQLGRLAGVLGKNERFAELLTEYLEGPGAADDSDEGLEIVREVADLWMGTLRKPERAVPLLRRLLTALPEETSIFNMLESALTQAEMWPELAEAYWQEAETSVSGDRQLELLRKLATLSQEMLEDHTGAARAYQRMLEIRPDYELARNRLEQIYTQTSRHEELLDLLRDRLTRLETPEERGDVSLQIAALQENALEDPSGSVDTLESMLMDLPDDRRAVEMLEVIAQKHRDLRPRVLGLLRPIYERSGNIRRLVEIDEWQLGHTEDPLGRHELFREMAEFLSRSQETAEAGFRTLCRALAEPGPVDVLESLDREVARVASALGLRTALAEAMVSAAHAEALATDIDRRVHLLVEAASIHADNGEHERVADLLDQALELNPDHEPALVALDAALSTISDHERLVDVLARRADVTTDDRERIELLRRRARLLEEVLDRKDAAIAGWRGLLDLEPADREALERLSRMYEAADQVPELIDVLERRVEATSDEDERRTLRMQLATLFRERTEDRTAEIDVLRASLSERPQDDEALAWLAEALVADEQHPEAADTLSERVELADDDAAKAALLLRVARLFKNEMQDSISALERYEQILGLEVDAPESIEDLVELARSEDYFEAAGAMVVPRLERDARWPELGEVLAARARLTGDPDEKVTTLRRLADLRLERLDDAQGALQALSTLSSVVDESGLPEVLERSGRLAVQLGQAPDYIDALAERVASDDVDGRIRVILALHAARLAEEIVGEPERALGILRPLLDAGLATVEVCLEVERLGRSASDFAAVEQALREASRMVADPVEQAGVLVRLGEVELELGETTAALDAFRDAFDLTQDQAAVRGLERLLERTADDPPPALLDVLENTYQALGDRAGGAKVVEYRLEAADAADHPRLLEQLAVLREQGGGTPEQALEAWGALLAQDVDSLGALERLQDLGRSIDALPRVVELMLAAVEKGRSEGRNVVPLSLQVAIILYRDLGDASRSLEVAHEILEEQPDHPEAMELRVQAARDAGDAEVLHNALVASATGQVNPQMAAALWSEAATVAEQRLGSTDLAISDLEQLIGVEENDAKAWTRLLTALSSAAEYDKLVDAIGRRVLISDDVEERRELRHRLANLMADKLDRDDDAIAVYQDMLTDRPDDTEAMHELEVLLRRLERWEDVRDILERKLEIAEAEERIAVLEELAMLGEHRLEDRIDATERYQQILMERPGYRTAEAALERLLTEEERWVDLADLLEARANRLRDAEDLAGYRTTAASLAEVLAERLEHPERAEEILSELLEEDPSYIPGLLAKAKVYESTGNEGAMRITLERALALEPQGEQGASLYLRLANLAHDDPEVRRQHLESALALSPGHPEVIKELAALYRAEGRWESLVGLLAQAIEAEEEWNDKRALILERVDVLLDPLGEPEAALEMLQPIYTQVQDDVEINRRIADALFAAERFEEAAGMYNWLVEMGRRNRRNKIMAHHLTRLARISMRSEDTNGARDKLLEAYRIDTTNVETLITLGELYFRHEEWKEALKIYRTMLLQNADKSGLLRRGDIYINLARAHLALEEAPKARAMLRRGLEEDGDHPEIGSKLAELEN